MELMEIYLTDTVTGYKMSFPMIPEETTTTAKTRFQQYDIMSKGEVMQPLGDNLTHFSWSGRLPGAKREGEPYVVEPIDPQAIQEFWSLLRHSGHMAHLMLTGTPINHDVYLEDYDVRQSGGHGDYLYTISFVQAASLTVETESEEAAAKGETSSKAPKTEDRGDNQKAKTYTVKKGDTLWRIAEKHLGAGSKYPEIASLNGLKDPNKINVGQVLNLP